MAERFKADFPRLHDVDAKKTSEATPAYNCIAWAFKDNRRWWWPGGRTYWPFNPSGMSTLEAFELYFRDDGWVETDLAGLEPGFEKIALYALNGVPTHAARLLDSGYWTSKLGTDIDIFHDPNDLDGPCYGAIYKIFKKHVG